MFQHLCVLCGALSTDRDLCTGCRDDLPWLGFACARCARPLPNRDAGHCGRCLKHPTLQAATVAALHYEFPVDQLVHKLKFGHWLPPGRVLGELLADAIIAMRAHERVDTLLAVPLHPKRLRERGFDQALEIARPVARRTRLPLLTRACRRIRHADPQSSLAGPDRRRNLKGSYAATAAVSGRRVAVIDDVYTTGTTIAAVTDALLHAGATRIEAWCVARGGHKTR